MLAEPPSGDPSTEDPTEADESGEWLVRAILSLLATPAADQAAERRLVQRLVDALLADGRASGMIGP